MNIRQSTQPYSEGNAGARVGEGGGGSHPPRRPSFLVRNGVNVNRQTSFATLLLTLWDYNEYRVRVGTTNVIFNDKQNPSKLLIIPAKRRSRYFVEGRGYISWRIKKRLGRFERVPGLMETLTYDPKKVSKVEAWASYGHDVRQFLNGVNQYRRRRGWRRTHYLWVVEVQPETGYPHVHIFFPNLRFLAPLAILNGNWSQGRANIESPKRITANCAAYVSKYLRKMKGWAELHLALLRKGGCRMYGFSRGLSAKMEKQETTWQRWHVVRAKDIEVLERTLKEGGFVIERGTTAS